MLLGAVVSCDKNLTDNPAANQPPRTFLWLYPDSTVGVGVSRQHLQWWGEDPDGIVRGYLFAFASYTGRVTTLPNPDTLRYSWISRNDTILAFPLDTLFRNYTLFIRAVDNTFRGLPERSVVKMDTGPYWDKNANGVFDGSDALLSDLPGAVDRRGAIETFPIRNSPPTIAFGRNPNDATLPLKQPDTTFTVATFSWVGSDADGDNTLSSYRIALNDTTNPGNWLTIPVRDTIVTLVVPRTRSDVAGPEVNADVYGGKFIGRRLLGTLQGLRLDALNVLFVQARDVAGEYSPPITMPSGTNHWYVKRPQGRLLLVSDYINPDAQTALSTYLTALTVVPGGVDHLDIGRGLTAPDKRDGKFGSLVPQFVDPAMIYTFLLYDHVLWYTEQLPSLGVAQFSLFAYLQNGGKVVFSTTFESSVDPRGALRDFAPIDSISSVDLSTTRPPVPPPVAGDTRVYGSYVVFADSTDPGNIYPTLQFNGTTSQVFSIFMRPVYRRADARYIFHLQQSHLNRYIGMPNVGVVDGQRSIVFIGLPLHLLNNTSLGSGLGPLFTRLFTQEFDPARHVNRRKF